MCSIKLLAAWDGHGKTAAQSHALRFEDVPVRRLAWPGRSGRVGAQVGGGAFFAAVIVGIVETAVDTARHQLANQRPTWDAYQQIEWSRLEVEAWLVQQAFEGLLRAIQSDDNFLLTARLVKLAIAELAESVLRRICRVVGGGRYSRHSPYGFWLEDPRILAAAVGSCARILIGARVVRGIAQRKFDHSMRYIDPLQVSPTHYKARRLTTAGSACNAAPV